MRPDELTFAARVEEINPVDRVRGTVVNVDASGIFVVKYDNGDYLAYQPEDAEGFAAIPDKPIPTHAMATIRALYAQHGRTPPEDVVLRREQAVIPGQSKSDNALLDESTLTPEGGGS